MLMLLTACSGVSINLPTPKQAFVQQALPICPKDEHYTKDEQMALSQEMKTSQLMGRVIIELGEKRAWFDKYRLRVCVE
jgi:hypothetical protein